MCKQRALRLHPQCLSWACAEVGTETRPADRDQGPPQQEQERWGQSGPSLSRPTEHGTWRWGGTDLGLVRMSSWRGKGPAFALHLPREPICCSGSGHTALCGPWLFTFRMVGRAPLRTCDVSWSPCVRSWVCRCPLTSPPTWLVIGRRNSQTPLGARSVCDPFTARASPPNLIFDGNFSTFTFLNFHLTILTRGL